MVQVQEDYLHTNILVCMYDMLLKKDMYLKKPMSWNVSVSVVLVSYL